MYLLLKLCLIPKKYSPKSLTRSKYLAPYVVENSLLKRSWELAHLTLLTAVKPPTYKRKEATKEIKIKQKQKREKIDKIAK